MKADKEKIKIQKKLKQKVYMRKNAFIESCPMGSWLSQDIASGF